MLNMKQLKRSALFGLYTVVVGVIVSMVVKGTVKMNLPPICKSWNKKHVMEMTLFLTGMLVFLTFELTVSKLSPLAKLLA